MAFIKRCFLFWGCIFWLFSTGAAAETAEKADWSIYIYMCGSDLESTLAAATLNLNQILKVSLPEGVQVIIEAGGTKVWHNDYFSPDHIERYIYDHQGFRRLEQLEQANMGALETFHDFLEYCDQNYPAKKDALIIWNHGGGIQNGVCFDENYQMDGLNGDELRAELQSEIRDDRYDLLGFDACLMGSLESCFALKNCAEYMVACEDTETGYGWPYHLWLGELAADPSMDTYQLAKTICNAYKSFNEQMGVGETATMSVINLPRIGLVQEKYEALGWELLRLQLEDESFFTKMKRYADGLFHFGAVGEEQNYENVDLLDLLEPYWDKLGKAGTEFYQDILQSCVYNASGEFSGGQSISVYFPLNGNTQSIDAYENMECSDSMSAFFKYCLTGELSDSACSFLKVEEEFGRPHSRKTLGDFVQENFEITEADNKAVAHLSPETMEYVTKVSYAGMYFGDSADHGLYLGWDDELECDWETGEIRAELMNWGIEFGGHLGYLGLAYQSDEYNLYDVPILLNDEPYYLHLIWKEGSQQFEILGVQKKQIDPSVAERNDIQLKSGDRIRMITKELTNSDETTGDFPSEEFVYEEGMTVTYRELSGYFGMMIVLHDQYGQSIWSELLFYDR